MIVDLDTQDQVAKTLGIRHDAGVADLVAGDVSPEEVIVQAPRESGHACAAQSLAGQKRLIARKDRRRAYGERGAHALNDRFDYVIIDTAPGRDASPSTHSLMPTRC